MRYGSICSGIEAASAAWHPLGWRAQWLSEIDPYACAVLRRHYPTVPLHADFTALDVAALPPVDVLVGGTPCQSFSSAGLGKSLADARGQLTLAYVKLVHELAAIGDLKYAIWENVVGCLQTPDNAFGHLLGGLVGAGKAIQVGERKGRWPRFGMVAGPQGRAAWLVVDAEHFGVAQRRRRVFVIFCPTASGRDPATALFEPPGAPRHKKPTTQYDPGFGGHRDRYIQATRANALKREVDMTRGPASIDGASFNAYQAYLAQVGATVMARDADKIDVGVIQDGMLRKYTVKERERMMGFPDNYTLIDGWPGSEITLERVRTKAVGNSMAVPVMRWLGERIQAAEVEWQAAQERRQQAA